jgi:DNA-binding HxlR family transcriptional regulator
MKGYGQFCPIAVACEVFAQRWTPLILRELFSGSRGFNDIHRGMPLISRTLLADRLRQLEEAGVIESAAGPAGNRQYALTAAGSEFKSVIDGLGQWGQRWTIRVQRRNLDAGLLMWNVRRRMALDKLPDRQLVVHIRFHGIPRKGRYGPDFWLVVEKPRVELCVDDPGLDVDVAVEADLESFAHAWLGDVAFDEMVRKGKIKVNGAPSLAKAFPSWLLFSHFAKVPRPALVE